jgi:hypothetical protein
MRLRAADGPMKHEPILDEVYEKNEPMTNGTALIFTVTNYLSAEH